MEKSDLEERMEKARRLREAAEADEAFGRELIEAMEARDTGRYIELAASKGVELDREDLVPIDIDECGRDLDADELEAIAAGGDGIEAWGCYLCIGYAKWGYDIYAN